MKKLFLLILSIFCINISHSRGLYLYGSEDLSSNLINDICQDSQGFLWVATEYGLNRFDGYRFNYYYSSDDSASLSDNHIISLQTDKQDLWVCTRQGIHLYNIENDNFEKISLSGEYESSNIQLTHFVVLKSGKIWLGTSGAGIIEVDKDSKKGVVKTEINKLYGNNYIRYIFEDNNHFVWISTENELVRIDADTKEATIYILPDILCSKIKTILEDENGNLIISTTNSMVMFDIATKKFVSLFTDSIKNLSINKTIIRKHGDLLIGTDGQGLKFIDKKKDKIESYNNSSHSIEINLLRITALFEDNQQNLWLGCYQRGLVMIPSVSEPFNFLRIRENNSELWNNITAIHKDSSGNIWSAADNKGIFVLNDEGEILKSYLSIKEVHAIFEDTNGTLWIGTNEGLAFLNKPDDSFVFLPFTKEWIIKTITESIDKKLYFPAFENGFVSYDLVTNEWTQYYNSRNNSVYAPTDEINTVLCDSNGLVWLGSRRGLACFNPDKNLYVKFNGYEHFSSLTCLALYEDWKSDLWVGTTNGLYHLNTKIGNYKTYTKSNGMSDNMICAITQDQHNNTWCSTFNGLNQILAGKDTVISYLYGNGLVDKIYNKNVCYTDKSGVIYFGSNNGITSFSSTQKLDNNPYEAPVIISNLYIGNERIKQKLNDTYKFYLPSIDNIITLELTTMDFFSPENIHYEFKIGKRTENWHATMPGYNKITLKLQPGKYSLMIRAAKNGKISPIKEIQLIIPAPWYKHYQINFVWLLILFLSGFIILKFLRRKMVFIIGRKQFQFLTRFPDEARSLLTLIISPSGTLLKKEHDPIKSEILQTIYNNGVQMLNLVDQLSNVHGVNKKKLLKSTSAHFENKNNSRQEKKKIKSKTNYKVLIIDNNKNMRDYLTLVLREYYQIITAKAGVDGLQITLTQIPDLIISDTLSTKPDGLTFIKKIRNNQNTSHIPIIILSSEINQENRINAFKEGADAFFTKPFQMEELVVVINNLITTRLMLKGKIYDQKIPEEKNKLTNTKSLEEAFVKRVMDTIYSNFGNPEFGVEMLATKVGISRIHLHRKIKEKMGISVSDLIRNIRLQQAALLLKEKKLNISEIAFAVGFSNQTHFSTAFKKFYGITPSEYNTPKN